MDRSSPSPSTRGILRPHDAAAGFRLSRHAPAPDLAYFVDYYWEVVWDLAEPVHRETLPFPSVHLAVQAGRCGAFGPVRRRFRVLLEGRGSVFAVKFRPGAFRPFLGEPVSRLTDGVRPLAAVFGPPGARLETEVLACGDPSAQIALAEAFLRARLPDPDPRIDAVNRVIDRIAGDRSITRVEPLVEPFGASLRTLQRTFGEYVGVSPKRVIQRYRLQEAAERLAHEGAGTLSRLALELGYADQAHFANDFRAIVGVTPGEYARQAAAPRPAATTPGPRQHERPRAQTAHPDLTTG